MSCDSANTLPLGWAKCSIADVSLPISKIDPKDDPDREISYIDISGIDNTRHVIKSVKQYRLKDAPSRARQIVHTGDVLFATVRPYLRNIACVPDDYNEQISSTGFSVLRPANGISPDFLFYKAISKDFVDALSAVQYGVSYPAVKDDQVRDQSLWLPPTDEQLRIVAKIEELFSELDKGVESIETARRQLQVYRQSVLKHAFQGKLTAQWRAKNKGKIEKPDLLLARIKREREVLYERQLREWRTSSEQWHRDGQQGQKPKRPLKPKSLPPIAREDLSKLPPLPSAWRWVRIGQIGLVGTGVTPLKSRSEYYVDGDIAWVTSGALNDSFISRPANYVTEAALNNTNLRLYSPNTLVIALYGEGKTRGKCSELLIKATTNQAIAAIVQEGSAAYLRGILKWFLTKNYEEVRAGSSGGVQPNLSLGIIENSPVPICSISEAAEIDRQIKRKYSQADELEEQLVVCLQRSDLLRQSILRRAFSGQLVAQDPSDEPASVLLDSIKTERNQMARSGMVRRRTRKKRGAV